MASLRRGKRMTFHGVVSLRIVGGKIVRFKICLDRAAAEKALEKAS